jgi:hypothetical protein
MYSYRMKYLYLACFLALLAPQLHAAYASDEEEDAEKNKPPEEIPDFSNLNEYIYQPKTTLNFGFRLMSGVKASFGGTGFVPAPEVMGNASLPNSVETYHDGNVLPDGRDVTQNNGNGTTTLFQSASDGKTNTWGYADTTQITSDGYMTFNIYSAAAPNINPVNASGKTNSGMEISVAHDMGNLGKKLSWSIFFGMALNDIQAGKTTAIKSQLTTTTDTYDLFGTTPPAPGSFPSQSTISVTDANGNPVIDTNGNQVSQVLSVSPLIGDQPLQRVTGTVVDTTSLVDSFRLHGAYATFRVGPTLTYHLNDHIKLSVSAGPAVIYAGTMYNVTEDLTPATGDPIVDTLSDTTQKLVPAVYVDATMEYDLTERTGLYLGAVYQDGGSYLQAANSTSYGTYTTKVDFANQNGVRSGLSFKF